MAKGFNHAIQLAISCAAGAGKLLARSDEQIANAIAIAAVDNISLACVHAEPVSQWKGFSPGMTGMRAIYAASLAKRGFTGPSGLFEGPSGLAQMLGQRIDIDWSNDSLGAVKSTVLKRFCALVHGQPVLEAVLGLKREHRLTANDIKSVRCDVFQTGYDIAGGGAFGSKADPRTKEQADYNLRYLVAAAMLDDKVGPDQLEPERVNSADAQLLLRHVEIHPDDDFTASYPDQLNARITIETRDGRTLAREQHGYEGGLGHPLSWDRTVEKFNWLSEPFASSDLRNAIIETVARIDESPIDRLMTLLEMVSPKAVFQARHPGIQ
jgi:2-methylcitrate dehydratase